MATFITLAALMCRCERQEAEEARVLVHWYTDLTTTTMDTIVTELLTHTMVSNSIVCLLEETGCGFVCLFVFCLFVRVCLFVVCLFFCCCFFVLVLFWFGLGFCCCLFLYFFVLF